MSTHDLAHAIVCLHLSLVMMCSYKIRPDVYVMHNLVLVLKQQSRDHEAYETYKKLLELYVRVMGLP